MCRTKFIYLLGILLSITIPAYTKDREDHCQQNHHQKL